MGNEQLETEFGTGDRLISQLERELVRGKANWIADFNESFRDYRVNDITYDVFMRGNTRVKGFLLSRLFSFFLNPNYEVGCYMHSRGGAKKLNKRDARKIIVTTKDSMAANNMKWSWLFLFADDVEEDAKEYLKTVTDRALAVVAVGTETRTIVSSGNFLGRQARKFIKM